MRRRAVLAGGAAAVALAAEARTADAAEIRAVSASGGLRAWLVEDRTAPLLSLSFSFEGGATLDPPGKEGLVSLAAGLLDQGGGTLDSRAFKERQDDLAVRLGFGASLDRVSGTLRTLTANRDAAFDLLRLALAQPRFDPEPLARARDARLAALRRSDQSPSGAATRALMRAMFADHPYGRDPDGTAQGVAAIEADDLRTVARRLFARDRLTVAAVGDISPADLAAALERAFGALPGQTEAIPATPRWSPPAAGRTLVIERAVPQSAVLAALPGPTRDDPDWYAALLANQILGGGGLQSRLFTEVREKRGLAYGASSSLRPLKAAGLLVATTATANERVAESVAILRAEIGRMGRDGPTAEELADAKAYLSGSLALALDSTASIAGLLHGMQVDGLAPDHLTRRAALLEAVTMGDARRVARGLMREELVTVAVAGRPVGVKPTE